MRISDWSSYVCSSDLTQLLMRSHLFGTEIPPDLRRGLVPRLQHRRRVLQARHPLADAPLRLVGAAIWTGSGIRSRADLARQADRALGKVRQGPRQAILSLIGANKGPKL